MNNSSANSSEVRVARVVQITDCHLGPGEDYSLANVRTYHSFREVLAHIVSSEIRPDLVMVSGDIAANGNEKAYQLFAEAMNETGLSYAWLPGNHDDYAKMETDMMSGHFWPSLDMGTWRLYSLNTARVGRVEGELSMDEMDFLSHNLAREPDNPAALFMHHPPVAVGCEWLDRQRVSNGEELLTLLRLYPQVKLIFTGHVHQEVSLDLGGIQLYSTPSTCFQFLSGSKDFAVDTRPPGYRWIDFYTDGTHSTGVVEITNTREFVNPDLQGY